MKLFRSTLAALALAGAASLLAQPVAAPATPRPRTSPHDTISARLDGNRVTIVYGRPYTRDPKTGQPRKIWGGLVPFGKVWRTGADEATLLINKRTGQWGADPYDAGQEFARVPLKQDALATPVDQFTMALDKNPGGGGVLKLGWEHTQYSVAYTVKK